MPPLAAAGGLQLVRREVRQPDPQTIAAWKPVVSHTHNRREGDLPFEQAKTELLAWCRRLGIAAVGIGSPWEPVSEAAFHRYEGPDRNLYYAGRVDPASLMFRDLIGNMFDELNRRAEGRTLFYMDNETPKCRLGHHWWFGYDYDVPAWHDYTQDRPVQYWEGDAEREINPLTGKPQRRRCLLEIMAVQRKAGAVGVFAHPTSWWLQDGRFVTNIASEIPLFLMADGYLDGIAVMGYDACHRGYQSLWFHLLDTGAVVPGFAETDFALDHRAVLEGDKAYMSYLHVPGPISLPGIVAAARRGAAFASTGAFLNVWVDGVPMGQIAPTRRGQVHRLRIEAYPRRGESRFSRIEVIGKGGQVVARQAGFAGGILEYTFPGSDAPGYIVVRAFGQHDNPDAPDQKAIAHMALSNPVYLHPRGFAFHPVRTEAVLEIPPGSSWLGGTLELQDAGGGVIEKHAIRAGTVRATLPASARVELRKPGLETRRFYIAMENPLVQHLLEYLYQGDFRKDYPGLRGGMVPPAAFRLEEMRSALQHFQYVIR